MAQTPASFTPDINCADSASLESFLAQDWNCCRGAFNLQGEMDWALANRRSYVFKSIFFEFSLAAFIVSCLV